MFKRIFLIFLLNLAGFIFFAGKIHSEVDKNDNNDLSVTSIAVAPKAVATDQDCWITVTVKNSGTSTLWSSEGINSINYSFPDFTIKETITPTVNSENTLKPSGVIYYKYRGSFLVRGTKTLKFTVDDADQIDETNESNNFKTLSYEVFTPEDQDLSVGITLSKTKPLKDESLTITVAIKNNGKVSLVDDKGFLTEVKSTIPITEKEIYYSFEDFDLDSVKYGSYPNSDNPLDPGETISHVYTGSFTTTGIKDLIYKVNTNNRLFELNKDNNTKAATTTIYKDAEDRDSFTISDQKVDIASSTQVAVNWNTNVDTSGKIEYKLTPSTSYTSEAKVTSAKIHQATLRGLWAGKNYTYKISATYGSVTKTAEGSFQLPSNNTITVTSGPNITVSNESKKAVFSWTTNLLSNGYVYYKTGTADYKKLGSDKYTSGHEVTLENLALGTYTYYLKSTSYPKTEYQSTESTFTISIPGENTNGSSDNNNSSTVQSTNTNSTDTTSQITIDNSNLYNNLKGKIILKIESRGEAYYVHPTSKIMYFLGRPDDAFRVMRERGVGITNANLNLIPVALTSLSGTDTDGDGLSDMLEDAIGTDKTKKDSDGDGYTDKAEVEGGFNPKGAGNSSFNTTLANAQKGKILLQVEGKGEAWYVNPANGKRYFLGRPADAFAVMRLLGLGISNSNFDAL